MYHTSRKRGTNGTLVKTKVLSALTDMADPIAESEEGADGFGIGLLHKQFNDGLAVGLNQVLALSSECGG